MKNEIPKAYNPKEVEDKIYQKWEESGYFNPDNLDLPANAKSFVISMPPPNATGVLHLGHASMLAYQDLMIRFNRLNGKRALWLPGTDHASIATQTRVEKMIAKEGKTKYDLGREKFLERVSQFVEDSRHTIKNQTKKMGSSCDWSRERYTLDDGLSRAVREVFLKMYNDGLIYRGDRIVNWCPRCESTLADDEVEHKDQKAKLYYFKYSKEFPITIASTRPETKLGDTAVAVNPKDERYRSYIGKTYEVDLGNGVHRIKIISDREVDMAFGTGALGVTPAHSMTDWQMAEKNDLDIIKVIGEDGKMKREAGKEYEGLTVLEARDKFVKYLEANNLIEKVEDVDQSLSICYRCDAAIEPLPSEQWFVDVDKKITIRGNKYFKNRSLKDVSLLVVENAEIEIIPDRFKKTYITWMKNLHDWCISRQLWFGHRIPVWYKEKSKIKNQKSKVGSENISNEKQIYVGVEMPEGEGWMQDSDTLDTWFSSGLWTFSTLLDQDDAKYKTFEDWVAGSSDIKKYHPTSVMETGYDIIFFWVARMILMTTYVLGEVPFENVYLHGMVRDKEGRKMSKSLGNGIDPIEMIEKYGTDALRLSMIVGSSPGGDLRLYEEKIEGYRNFVNKLWNISRYVLMSVEDINVDTTNIDLKAKTLADKWILENMENLKWHVTSSIERYYFSSSFEGQFGIREFMWEMFADQYLEFSKGKTKNDAILVYVLENLLKLCHPFIPFITEQVWQEMGRTDLLMVEEWPRSKIKSPQLSYTLKFDALKQLISIIREKKNNFGISARAEIDVKIDTLVVLNEGQINDTNRDKIEQIKKEEIDAIKENLDDIKRLAGIKNLEFGEDIARQKGWVLFNFYSFVGHLYVGDSIDVKKEAEKTKKEIENVKNYVAQLKNKLSNEKFVSNAPVNIVEKEREKLKESEEKLQKMDEKLKSLL